MVKKRYELQQNRNRPEIRRRIMSIELILRRISLFDTVEENALPELARSLESIRLEAGRILFYENDPGDCFYIIVTGNLEIIKAFGSTEERLLKDLGPGNFIGEMSMFDL
jgi:CRP-like cAMP-binding protein